MGKSDSAAPTTTATDTFKSFARQAAASQMIQALETLLRASSVVSAMSGVATKRMTMDEFVTSDVLNQFRTGTLDTLGPAPPGVDSTQSKLAWVSSMICWVLHEIMDEADAAQKKVEVNVQEKTTA